MLPRTVFASITAGSLAVMPVLCFACFGADDTGAGQSGCSKASLTMHMYICYNAELVTATIILVQKTKKRSSSISKMNRGPRHIPTRLQGPENQTPKRRLVIVHGSRGRSRKSTADSEVCRAGADGPTVR